MANQDFIPKQELIRKPFEVFLIGDTGSITRGQPDRVFEALRAQVDPKKDSAIIFLGDNIYPRGMPAPNHILRKDAEAVIEAHQHALEGYHGRILFLSGNHDWNNGREDGYQYVLQQEKYLKELFGDRGGMFPSKGHPGPTVFNLSPSVTIVMINTQWWMQGEVRLLKEEFGGYNAMEEKFFEDLNEALNAHQGKHILLAGHHPLYSYSSHGGRFKLKHHLFPFTIYDRGVYIPLPFIGSLLPLYRKYLGHKEDMSHPRYRNFRKGLKEIFAKHHNLIYASGHEHNLQYICKNGNHFIVSGAGSKIKYVIHSGKNLEFGIKSKGFFKLNFENDGSVFLSCSVVDFDLTEGKIVYERQII